MCGLDVQTSKWKQEATDYRSPITAESIQSLLRTLKLAASSKDAKNATFLAEFAYCKLYAAASCQKKSAVSV